MNREAVFETDVERWAEEQFGGCDLGDQRRTRRLVAYAARQATDPSASTHAVCEGDDAFAEGVYRWLRNPAVEAEAVAAGPMAATAAACRGRPRLLAIQDTSTLVFSHAVADELGPVGSVGGNKVRGVLVHTTLMVDGTSGEPLGVIDQERWERADGAPQRKGHHKQRAYADKESIKWERATQRMSDRLETIDPVITVCDREADVYDYLVYLTDRNHRFVIRAGQDRCLQTNGGRLSAYMAKQPVVGQRRVSIAQRGPLRGAPKRRERLARPGRRATMSIRTAQVEIARPANRHDGPASLSVGVVYLREIRSPEGYDRLEWLLLTTEPLSTPHEVDGVIESYERRWLIEDFHKAWKTGCRVEHRRLQSADNLKRLMVVLVPIAVRLLQLRTLAQSTPSRPCSTVLSTPQWQCLFAKMSPNEPLPTKPPSLNWALSAIARLGGWRDTKRNGRIGWQTLWRGWARLDALLDGWRLAQLVAGQS